MKRLYAAIEIHQLASEFTVRDFASTKIKHGYRRAYMGNLDAVPADEIRLKNMILREGTIHTSF